MGWNRTRLEDTARTRLGGAKLIVVANREPYIHRYEKNGEIDWIRPAGGLTTALDPVMQACGGVWIAHGSGSADRAVTNELGQVDVPPDNPTYRLRRVWLTKEQENGYYFGFANSTLWPLCHQAYCRPEFNPEHWETYKEVNQQFADAVIEESADEPTIVFVQDYHFALLPRMVKSVRPDIVVVQFWHIPWPNPETFRVCPWAREILDGMLGNDLMAFHIQYHCNNFLDTVDRNLECRIARDSFSVSRNGHDTLVQPHPISIDPELAEEYLGSTWEDEMTAFRETHRLGDRKILAGVDRVDYTKGIPERLRAVSRLMELHPEWIGEFHFVQIGAPSRTDLPAYRNLNDEICLLVDDINTRFGREGWEPIVFINEHAGPEVIFPLYRAADGYVVSSLHDGMNLVAKEFVAARTDEAGVLVLSRFTGAARELTHAILFNPFDIEELAEGMHTALTMPIDEQRRRMALMRAQVQDHNVYRWAGMLLSQAAKLATHRTGVIHREEPVTSDDDEELATLLTLSDEPYPNRSVWETLNDRAS